MKLIFVLHVLSTLLMVGVIWMVQLVHYPLFAHVGAEQFPQYEGLHRTWISMLVMPLMLIEIGTGALLLLSAPAGISPLWFWAGAVLLGVIWASTFFIQVPLHDQILKAFDVEAIQRLVRSNWIRTMAWSLRGGILGFVIWKMLNEKC